MKLHGDYSSSCANVKRTLCSEDGCEFPSLISSSLCKYHHHLNLKALKKINEEADHTPRNLSLWILLMLGLFAGVGIWVFSK